MQRPALTFLNIYNKPKAHFVMQSPPTSTQTSFKAFHNILPYQS